jgi:hypothetical protein
MNPELKGSIPHMKAITRKFKVDKKLKRRLHLEGEFHYLA